MKEPRVDRVDPLDSGSVSVFVIGLVASFIVAAGLAVDGGRLVAARIAVSDHAENAARVGAQQVGSVRSGQRRLSSAAARAAALEYLASQGLTGDVIVGSRTIMVTIRMSQSTTILRLVGVTERTITASRSAEITSS
ncbi:MAG: Tad domain-containing protein [Ilumatobacteraceae bacterium]